VGLVNRVRPRVGDVIEIPTPDGFGYAHYTHKQDVSPGLGALLRVFPEQHRERPHDFAGLVLQRPAFSTFFPLGAACSRRIVRIVASEPVPPHTAAFPTFRNAFRDRSGRLVPPWSLWDGAREWRVESLSGAQWRDCPPLEIINDTLLIERIVSGWRHEQDR
jgi:hypothetical protein